VSPRQQQSAAQPVAAIRKPNRHNTTRDMADKQRKDNPKVEARRLVSHKMQRNLRSSSGGTNHHSTALVMWVERKKPKSIHARLRRIASSAQHAALARKAAKARESSWRCSIRSLGVVSQAKHRDQVQELHGWLTRQCMLSMRHTNSTSGSN
jgi:hypothetical protein